jgi:tetratricopeptide (TPR) repeat protein
MRHFVEGALAIDPNLADAFVSQASLRMFEWDWPGAEKSFHRAIDLNPNDTLAHLWYGWFLEAMGRQQESLAERTRAWELDPLSWNANASVGRALGALGRHDEAIQHLQAAVELNPNFFFARQYLGREYLSKGMADRAVREFEAAPDPPSLGYAYAMNGKKPEAERLLAQMHEDPLTNSFDFAIVNTGLGRTAEALDLLERARQERILWLMFLRVDERLASLRGNPRFETIASAMRIPTPRN